MEQETKLLRQNKLQSEKERLISTDKINNFTNLTLPTDFVNLFNKGTNDIPTSENFKTSTLEQTIQTEIDKLIKKRNYNTLKIKSTGIKNLHKPYTKLLNAQQSQPNFNLHLIDYVINTTAYTITFIFNPVICKLFFSHNTLTLHHHNSITFTVFTIVQTPFSQNLTKTWDGHLCLSLGLLMNTTNILRTLLTYQQVDNFNFNTTVTNSNNLQKKLKLYFDKLLTPNHTQLLRPVTPNLLQLPYMKLLPKVHKLDDTASTHNLSKLTGRPIITAHSWVTSTVTFLTRTMHFRNTQGLFVLLCL